MYRSADFGSENDFLKKKNKGKLWPSRTTGSKGHTILTLTFQMLPQSWSIRCPIINIIALVFHEKQSIANCHFFNPYPPDRSAHINSVCAIITHTQYWLVSQYLFLIYSLAINQTSTYYNTIILLERVWNYLYSDICFVTLCFSCQKTIEGKDWHKCLQ